MVRALSLKTPGAAVTALPGNCSKIMDTATITVAKLSESPLLRALSADLNTDLVDLHCHSTASDGILSPAQLVSRAKCQGVTLMALTDHDTVDGVAQAQEAGDQLGITVLAGIEFSSLWGRRSIHIVGLNVDLTSQELRNAISLREGLRLERAERIAERLHKRGFIGALEGGRAVAGESVLGRPHFARWLVEAGHVEDTARAFKRYLGAGKVGDVKVEWPQMVETIETIHAAGGSAVLAHPLKYGFTRTQLVRLLGEFSRCGGDAIELLCGRQNPTQTKELRSLMSSVTTELNGPQLRCSLGSDFHQPDQPWRELGCVRLPEDVEPVWNLWHTLHRDRPGHAMTA
ncbi:PHP domain-containing protein [Microbulbifer sp. MLAF003]|uniref:PHP domain-containing protein n=1 Tax=Microbulbifer sp. MLAF003 TaxID=3032582 RepID=UPI0024AE5742|nr:PHP domain-containing protein [Microbulbifer sp. MLAF003]WHI52489.1 PHP domain-containing protein [Microbulbifer sp. MLAF003]